MVSALSEIHKSDYNVIETIVEDTVNNSMLRRFCHSADKRAYGRIKESINC